MKYGQIIKPEDVPAMVRSGELEFGMTLEFQKENGSWFSGEFGGFFKSHGLFLPVGDGWHWREKARFPLPDLRDGDPAWCRSCNDKNGDWFPVKVQSISEDGLRFYTGSGDRWIHQGVVDGFTTSIFTEWRLPTKKELREAGMENWFDGRIELEEG